MDKKERVAFSGLLGTFLVVVGGIRAAANLKGEVDGVTDFLKMCGHGFILFIGDPLAWFGFALFGVVAIICRDDIREWWRPDAMREAAREHRERGADANRQLARWAYDEKVETRNDIQRGMWWLIDNAENDEAAYSVADGNSWLASAFGFIQRLKKSHRTQFGCTANPNFREFRNAVARFRVIADDLRPEDTPD